MFREEICIRTAIILGVTALFQRNLLYTAIHANFKLLHGYLDAAQSGGLCNGTRTAASLCTRQPISWQERAETLSKLQNWDINAVMSIRTLANNEGAQLILSGQHKQDYSLLLYTLGADALKFRVNLAMLR